MQVNVLHVAGEVSHDIYYAYKALNQSHRLLMVDLGEDEEKFEAFMQPLTQSFEGLGNALLANGGNYNTEEVMHTTAHYKQKYKQMHLQVRKTVIGLARDLRGIAFAFNTKVSDL